MITEVIFRMKRFLSLLSALILLLALPPARAEKEDDPLSKFAIRNGRRDEKKVAITVDDFFDLEYAWKIRDLFHELGVVGTFFPCGFTILPEDGPEWQLAIDYGIEIGSHNWGHYKMGRSNAIDIISALGRTQQALDAALGYHYQINSFRPPEGNMTDQNGSNAAFRRGVLKFGYEHVVLWEVSQTNPEKALQKVKNGSILLYHTRNRDYKCLQQLIPELLSQGYELVTVSDLLGFGPNEISPEPYVFNKADYQQQK